MSAAFLSAWQVNAKRGWGGGDELDAGDVFVDADLMAACAAGGHGGMNGFAFVLAFVALEALGGVGVLVEGDGMHGGASARRQQSEHDEKGPDTNANASTMARGRPAKAVAMKEKFHKPTKIDRLTVAWMQPADATLGTQAAD